MLLLTVEFVGKQVKVQSHPYSCRIDYLVTSHYHLILAYYWILIPSLLRALKSVLASTGNIKRERINQDGPGQGREAFKICEDQLLFEGGRGV